MVAGFPFDHTRLFYSTDDMYRLILIACYLRAGELQKQADRERHDNK